jgi:hypothetical protein
MAHINKITDKGQHCNIYTEIHGITRKYFGKNIYSNNVGSLQEMDTFLGIYDLSN